VAKKITSKHQLRYCPVCGSKVERERVQVSRYKTNLRVKCEKHGSLVVM